MDNRAVHCVLVFLTRLVYVNTVRIISVGIQKSAQWGHINANKKCVGFSRNNYCANGSFFCYEFWKFWTGSSR